MSSAQVRAKSQFPTLASTHPYRPQTQQHGFRAEHRRMQISINRHTYHEALSIRIDPPTFPPGFPDRRLRESDAQTSPVFFDAEGGLWRVHAGFFVCGGEEGVGEGDEVFG
jgi:hypothetical protein